METTQLTGFKRRLVDEGLISITIAEEAWSQSLKLKQSFVKYLVDKKGVPSLDLAYVISDFFDIPLLDLAFYQASYVPDLDHYKVFLKDHYELFPLYERGNTVYVAVYDPNVHEIEEFKFHSKKNVVPIIVESDKLSKFIDDILYVVDSNPLDQFSSEAFEDLELSVEDESVESTSHQGVDDEDAPVVRFVHKALLDAIKLGASDIHFEPYDDYFRIRYRRDGILHEVTRVSVTLASRITARLKVLSRLDVSERRLPQDGRFKVNLSHANSIDFRVSSCPVANGEKVVIRILDPASVNLGIEQLGFEPEMQALFMRKIHQSQGMILVTGPTGSGKTVTLYSALQLLNNSEKNISTIEDPIEIRIAGINQVQINPKAGLIFSTALKAFLRQDPDIIMIGEMRDLETAEIGVKASQTGHLVLSTLHTNSAAETLTRLVDMGISPFNLGSSVSLIVAQRLVRRLCAYCKKSVKLPEKALLNEGFRVDEIEHLEIFEPVGCEHCMLGFKGRLGVYELMDISLGISSAIMSGANALDLLKIATGEGMLTLRMSGLDKVRAGLTSLEEINRVIVS